MIRIWTFLVLTLLFVLPAWAATSDEYYIGRRAGVDVLKKSHKGASVLIHLDRLTSVKLKSKRRAWWKISVAVEGKKPISGWVLSGAVRKRYKAKEKKHNAVSGLGSLLSRVRGTDTTLQKTAALGVRGLEDESIPEKKKAEQKKKNLEKQVKWIEHLKVTQQEVDTFIEKGDLNP